MNDILFGTGVAIIYWALMMSMGVLTPHGGPPPHTDPLTLLFVGLIIVVPAATLWIYNRLVRGDW